MGAFNTSRLPGCHNLIIFSTPCQPKMRGLPHLRADLLGGGKRRGVCVPGGWGEEEGERGGKRDTGFWPPAKKNN